MDRQNHLISLVAVFLALGIGILVGASMGEDTLILNQIAVIESLRNEILRYKDEVRLHFSSVERLQEELHCWESLEAEYFNPLMLENKLCGTVIKVLCQGDLDQGLEEFLNLSGCIYYIFTLKANSPWEDPSIRQEFEDVLDLRAGSSTADTLNSALARALLEYGISASISAANIIELLQEKNMLVIQKSSPLATAFSGEEYLKEIFIIAGPPDPFSNDLLEHIQEEKVTIHLELSTDQEKILYTLKTNDAPPAGAYNLDRFYGRLKLLELLLESAE